MHPISQQDGSLFRTWQRARWPISRCQILKLHLLVIEGSNNKVGLAVVDPDGAVDSILPYDVVTIFLKKLCLISYNNHVCVAKFC